MFMSEVNYTSMESSPQEEISNSDVENVAMSPDNNNDNDNSNNNRIDVVNVEQLPFDDQLSVKSGRNGDCSRSWTMEKVQVGYDITRKGERSLVVDGFKFTKSRDGTNNRVFWRCSRRECKATAVTVCDRVEHVRAIHAHEPPLAGEFFGSSQEGVSQRCQLQEVRFNTSAANMRPRYHRRTAVSGSEGGVNAGCIEESGKDLSNAIKIEKKPLSNQIATNCKPLINLISTQPAFHIQQSSTDRKPVYSPSNLSQKAPSVKEQVRDFILRNSSIQPQPQHNPNQNDNNINSNNSVSVAEFLISPASQTQFIQTNAAPISAGSANSANSGSTIFNFSTMQINASPNAGSDSTSEPPSHKSTPGVINLPTTPRDEALYKSKVNNDCSGINQLNLEQIIQILLNKNASNRQRSSSDSEWMAGNSSSTVSYEHESHELSPCAMAGLPTADEMSYTGIAAATASAVASITGTPSNVSTATPTRLIHWKKEKLRESESSDELFRRERKRRHEDVNSNRCNAMIELNAATCLPELRAAAETNDESGPASNELFSFLNSFRPTITHKLMGVMQKLSSELCPEEAVAQEVFEKCTAIKTCLETLEKLHSLMSC